jgi:DNA-binding transcriptional MerR regulator
MDEPRKRTQTIKEYLEHPEVQVRIQQKIREARLAATVTIGRAAKLFGFSENQLRDWEIKRGWLTPQRPESDSSPEQDGKRHRQYAPAELDRLAVIRLLIDSDYTPADIDQSINTIRNVAEALSQPSSLLISAAPQKPSIATTAQEATSSFPPIDQLIDRTDSMLFWRFYVASVLRLSLMLLHEDIPSTIIGLVLPVESLIPNSLSTANIKDLGPCLIGWLKPGLSFYLLYDPVPSFEQHTDFRMHRLQVTKNGIPQEEAPQDNIWLIVQRRTPSLNISFPVVTTIRRLLAPLYQRKEEWLSSFVEGQRSFSFPATDISTEYTDDVILPKLADLTVSLGSDRGWRFACILTPHDPQLPVSQHKLVVRAKSVEAPEAYEIGTTLVSPLDEVISVSLRAYQSGRICYRHFVTPQDKSVAHAHLEEPIGSAIAVPIGGEDAAPLGVIYLVSRKSDAFNNDDRRVLRMIARIAQELLLTYQMRLRISDKLTPLINNPDLADLAFAPFFSETDLIADLEAWLGTILKRDDLEALLSDILALEDEKEQREAFSRYYATNDVLSFYCIDVNDQTRLTQRYGNIMTRNLSREVGIRAKNILPTLFTNTNEWKLYQAYSDRYYILLKGIPLEEARIKIWSLKDDLDGTYSVDALHFSTDQPTPSEMLVREEITVRMGIACYPYLKLFELMRRPHTRPYPSESVTAIVRTDFDQLLKQGPGVYSWDPAAWRWIRLERPKQNKSFP